MGNIIYGQNFNNELIDAITNYDQRDIAEGINLIKSAKKVYLIGNGGSASIASHIALDLWKNCKKPAFTFNDLVSLTAVSNDNGFTSVFSLPIKEFLTSEDLLICISSSGNSENIVNAAVVAKLECKAKVMSLVGFAGGNSWLKKNSDLQFYIDCSDYGVVEITHLAILHNMVNYLWHENSTNS